MSDFIIATSKHVIRKSEVMIVGPMRHLKVVNKYYFIVTFISGITMDVYCCNNVEADAQVERDAFLRSLTN